ncbi:hypothetical protein A8F58_04180 [Burkholderia cenocepacia]|nr:hypothetical protein A8F58_04180 [Burkholderia cenocepacia]OOA38900.1 hypothetical protein A8F57_22295 [Burkholderia cenocepacia]
MSIGKTDVRVSARTASTRIERARSPRMSTGASVACTSFRDCFIKAVRCAEECSSKSGSNRV